MSRAHDRRNAARWERIRASKQFDGRTFRNRSGVGAGLAGDRSTLLRDMVAGAQRAPRAPLPMDDPREAWASTPETGLRATWLGHSTVLLEIDGVRVLTDPVFGARASPMSFAGPKRFHAPPVSLDQLPELDAIVVSHDHYDHLCRPTMQALSASTVPIVTSLGVGAHLEAMGIAPERITELDWHEHTEIRGLRITATPCQHFSGRTLADRNHTLWSSWVLQGDTRKVFFSGDSGLTDEFTEIRERYGSFDLVLLEIGAYHPSWSNVHMGPEGAMEAFEMLGGGVLLPVHWGTFKLAFHAWDEPAETLVDLASARGASIATPRLGQAFELKRMDALTPWWRDVGQRRGSVGERAA